MVNNSINRRKNEQPSLTSNHLTLKRPLHMSLEIQVLAWDGHKDVAGLKGIPTLQMCRHDFICHPVLVLHKV
jgi:hypothetical protein